MYVGDSTPKPPLTIKGSEYVREETVGQYVFHFLSDGEKRWGLL